VTRLQRHPRPAAFFKGVEHLRRLVRRLLIAELLLVPTGYVAVVSIQRHLLLQLPRRRRGRRLVFLGELALEESLAFEVGGDGFALRLPCTFLLVTTMQRLHIIALPKAEVLFVLSGLLQ